MSKSFQERTAEWVIACFGDEIACDKIERRHRFLEEALELFQACDATREEAFDLVDYVFDRPVGDKPQEAGGTLMTLAALCTPHEIDMAAAGEAELARVWTKVEVIRAKQAAKPKGSPLPQSHENQSTISRLRAEVTAAEKSRDEALAELNKALETLGQLRSDLRTAEGDRDNAWRLFNECAIARDSVGFVGTVPDCIKYLDDRAQSAEKERDAFEKEATKQTVRAASAETDLGVQRTRAQSAEASLAKLREALGFAAAHSSICAFHMRRKDDIEMSSLRRELISRLEEVSTKTKSALLDEPDKDQNNAKR